MKKVLVLLLALSIQCCAFASTHHMDRQLKELKKNKKYNTVKQLTTDYSNTTQLPNFSNSELKIKDPELVKLKEFKKINDKTYNAKLSKDEDIYKKTILPILNKRGNNVNIDPEPVDFYRVYRIAERIIRANNLDYANWRIAIRKTPEDYNAYASSTNLVVINTALYDTLYNNEDAFAFIIAHEMAHCIQGHTKRLYEIANKMDAINRSQRINDTELSSAFGSLYKSGYKIKASNELKMMEYMADAEGLNLIIRAGYSPTKAMEAFNTMKTVSVDKIRLSSTHPITDDRIASAKENISFASPNWIDEGKLNIYNSQVIPCKKSSDRVSIVLNKTEGKSEYYQPEDIEDKLLRLAYISYKNGKMEDAIKYFSKLTDVVDNYAYYLYISYANEYLYKTTHEKKYVQKAQKALTSAKSLAPENEHIKEQENALTSFL